MQSYFKVKKNYARRRASDNKTTGKRLKRSVEKTLKIDENKREVSPNMYIESVEDQLSGEEST